MAPDPVAPEVGQAPGWAEINMLNRRDAAEWASATHPLPRLLVLALATSPQLWLTTDYFKQASQTWDEEEMAALLSGSRPRRFRVIEAAKCTATCEYFSKNGKLMQDVPSWKLLGGATQRDMSMAFAVMSRGAGTILQLIHQEHKTYPYKLFRYLEDEALANDVAADP